MKTIISLILILRTAVDSAEAPGENSMLPKVGECGKLNEAYFYNEKNISTLDEFPWIGQIFFKIDQNKIICNRCGAVLIGKRHFLANASCMEEKLNGDPVSVVLGRWGTDAGNYTAQDCHERKVCGPNTRVYEIQDIALHHNYNDKLVLHLNDIALVRMTEDVVFSEHIKPICLPPAASAAAFEAVGQYLTYAGHDFKSLDKRKTVAHMRSLKSCRASYAGVKDLLITDNDMCGSCYDEIRFLPGSALMVLTAADAEPSNFYLYALLMGGPPHCSPDNADIFIRVAPYLEWIKYNMI